MDIKEIQKFNKINIEFNNNDIAIKFKENEYYAESYIAIKWFINKNKKCLIYVTGKDEKGCIYKNLQEKKILENMNYINFTSWLSELSIKSISDKSGYIKEANITGFEIRKLKKIELPTVLGCEDIKDKMLKEVYKWTLEH